MAKQYEPGDLNKDQILDKLIRFCDYQERCKYDLYKKFNLLGVIDRDEKINYLKKLEEDGYLNEERFVRAFVRGKYNIKKWGIKRIERELKFRKIDEALYSGLLEELQDENYQAQFEELAKRKWEVIKGKSLFEKKGKLFRFLYNKGYHSEMISDFLKKV